MQVEPLIIVEGNGAAPIKRPNEIRNRKIKQQKIPPIDVRPLSAVKNIISKTAANDYSRDLRSKVHRQTPGHRFVSLFWQEKFGMLFDNFQILGILWTSDGAWPALWLVVTQWTTFIAGDVLSFTEYYSNSLSLPSTWSEQKASYYALYLPGVCICVPLLIVLIHKIYSRCCSTSSRSSLTFIIKLSECVYVPILLCLLQLFTCKGRIDQWSFPNDALLCWGWFGGTVGQDNVEWYVYIYVYIMPFLSLLIGIIYLIWLPVQLNNIIYHLNIYTELDSHECYINTKELEYLLHINTDYEDEHFSLISSYKRYSLHQRERMIYLKFLLVSVKIGLMSYNLHTWSMVVLTSIILLWAIVQTLAAPYRTWSR
jgi:hypothetical protein